MAKEAWNSFKNVVHKLENTKDPDNKFYYNACWQRKKLKGAR